VAGLSCRTDQILVQSAAYPASADARATPLERHPARSWRKVHAIARCSLGTPERWPASPLRAATSSAAWTPSRSGGFSDAQPIQRVQAWPAVGGDSYRRVNARPIGSGTVRESHTKPVELSSSFTAKRSRGSKPSLSRDYRWSRSSPRCGGLAATWPQSRVLHRPATSSCPPGMCSSTSSGKPPA